MLELRSQYNEVSFVILSMGALGVMNNLSNSFLDMMKDIDFDECTRICIARRLIATFIRATYYMFCRRNKDWLKPELLTFQDFYQRLCNLQCYSGKPTKNYPALEMFTFVSLNCTMIKKFQKNYY